MLEGEVGAVASVRRGSAKCKGRGHKAAKPRDKRVEGGRGGLDRIGERVKEGRELAQCATATTLEITVAVIPYDDLVSLAGGRDDPRILVNYLRHEATPYDSMRWEYPPARDTLKIRTLNAIADAYPCLREECERQADETLAAAYACAGRAAGSM